MPKYERVPMDAKVENLGSTSRQRVKVCTRCKLQMRLSGFPKNPRNSDGLDAICKSCRAEAERERRRAKNPVLEEQERLRKERARYRYRTRFDPFQLMVNAARTRAKNFKVPFALSANDLLKLWDECGGVCPVSGRPMDLRVAEGQGKRSPYKASLDRIEPALGYVLGNVRFVCWQVNAMKQNGSDAEMLDWCKAVVDTALRKV